MRVGSYAGISARTVGHQLGGIGGFSQLAGSLHPAECVGMTSVPASVSTVSSASTTACAPPTTHPIEDSEVCTITVIPGSTPRRRRSADSVETVIGSGVRSTAAASDMVATLAGSVGRICRARRAACEKMDEDE